MERATATGLDPRTAAIRAPRATAGAKPFDAALTATLADSKLSARASLENGENRQMRKDIKAN